MLPAIGILFFAFVAVTVLVFGFIIWSAISANRKRKPELAQWVARHGWQRLPDDPHPLRSWRGQPFHSSHSSARNNEVLHGVINGWRVTSFQYVYVVRNHSSTGSSSTTHYYHVIALELPTVMPMLELTKENVATRMGRVFGVQDIQFESEDFNRAWYVRASDKKFAFDVIRPQTMELLMSQPYLGLPWRIEGNTMVTWHSGKQRLDRIYPETMRLISILNTIPPFVWDDAGYIRDGRY